MLKDITPENFACHTDDCCPAIFETDNDSYVIIGKKIPLEHESQISTRVGTDEFVIEVPKGMIDQIINKRKF